MPGPLSGVRVLELPAIGPVPFLGMLLADLGADVIRIDKLAGTGGLADALAASPMGRGRRSIGLDLRKPGGAEVALRLAASCDVLIEGFGPGSPSGSASARTTCWPATRGSSTAG